TGTVGADPYRGHGPVRCWGVAVVTDQHVGPAPGRGCVPVHESGPPCRQDRAHSRSVRGGGSLGVGDRWVGCVGWVGGSASGGWAWGGASGSGGEAWDGDAGGGGVGGRVGGVGCLGFGAGL